MAKLAKNFILAISVSTGLLHATQERPGAVVSYGALTEAKMDSIIVARVGDVEITAKEFLLSYEYGPAFVKRRKDSKKRYLEFMIYEKLLALDGFSQGLDSSRQLQQTLAEFEGDLATEELYKEDIMSKVTVSESEIVNALRRERQHLTLKWIYAPTYEDMAFFHKLLKAGARFDSLFTLQLKDSASVDDRTFETTRFRLEAQNSELSAIVDTLSFGKISDPINTPDGWYIIKIVDLWTNPIMAESEQMKLRQQLKRALFQRKVDALSDEYVHEIMLQQNPVIKRRIFDALCAHMGKEVLDPEKYTDWKLDSKLMAESGPVDFSEIEDFKGRELVKLSRHSIELGAFLAWYNARKAYIRLRTTSRKIFLSSIQQLVWRMVRDKLLTERAFQRGLQHRESVKTQKKWWKEKITSALVKSNISNEIDFGERRLQEYYEKNYRSYRDRKGKRLSFEKAKHDVRREYLTLEFNKKMLRRILESKKRYKIIIYQDALDNLHVDMENQPKAIEVYTAKKGGIYPRPAYPGIDFDWQSWY